MKKFLIQIFYPTSADSADIGFWTNTNWGADDFDKALQTMKDIAAVPNRPFSKVRMLEQHAEEECQWGGVGKSLGPSVDLEVRVRELEEQNTLLKKRLSEQSQAADRYHQQLARQSHHDSDYVPYSDYEER